MAISVTQFCEEMCFIFITLVAKMSFIPPDPSFTPSAQINYLSCLTLSRC